MKKRSKQRGASLWRLSRWRMAAIALLFGGAGFGWTAPAKPGGDISEAQNRTHAQNFKDAVLAGCIARLADKGSTLYRDANSSTQGLLALSLYHAAQDWNEVDKLVTQYLARDYRNPIIENNNQGVRFDVVKCFDMYHSKALEKLVRQRVIRPGKTHRQEYGR